ncbi:MAG: cytochrome ubiquinol oxidase subunit I [Pseudonocardiaceae bacterium]|nr:cytochrome ubiquinol oxidase subunit I [Pseudonocardiaceae bacterium]
MTEVKSPLRQPVPAPVYRRGPRGSALLRYLATTDHKQIGVLYLVTSFAFFMVGGAMALLMRTELGYPGLQFLSQEQYNQLFTMHGTIMLLLYATPNVFGFANFVLPLQIGSPDVAFPRLNAFSYWLFLFGGSILLLGFITPGGAADFGWFGYAPLHGAIASPGVGGDLWAVGLIVSGLGTILAAVNMITTIACLRGPGMTMWRMPIFTWNILFTSVLVLAAFPVLTAALFGYKALVWATAAITGLSFSVWAHHMFATGAVLLPFFSLLSFLIAVPTGIKFFNWIGTMWKGQLTFETPMLFSVGFLVTFLFGGLSGVLLAAPVIDFHTTDTYFVVAHFHYVLFGTIVFATFAGIYFWFPKITGRMMDEPLGKLHFWVTFIGFHTTFLVHHWLGNEGMPRRYADYLASDGFTALNVISTIGAYLLGISMLPFLWNIFRSYKYGRPVDVDDPWGHGNSLEWATSTPPPRHNFTELPRIRSERPAFELHYPHMVERIHAEAHVTKGQRSRKPPAPSEEMAAATTQHEVRDPREK